MLVLHGKLPHGVAAYLRALAEAGGVLWGEDVVERVVRKVAGALAGSSEVALSHSLSHSPTHSLSLSLSLTLSLSGRDVGIRARAHPEKCLCEMSHGSEVRSRPLHSDSRMIF